MSLPINVELSRDTPVSGECTSVNINNDNILEEEEFFTLLLSTTSGDALIDDMLNETEIVIIDNDRKDYLSQAV